MPVDDERRAEIQGRMQTIIRHFGLREAVWDRGIITNMICSPDYCREELPDISRDLGVFTIELTAWLGIDKSLPDHPRRSLPFLKRLELPRAFRSWGGWLPARNLAAYVMQGRIQLGSPIAVGHDGRNRLAKPGERIIGNSMQVSTGGDTIHFRLTEDFCASHSDNTTSAIINTEPPIGVVEPDGTFTRVDEIEDLLQGVMVVFDKSHRVPQ